jgi:hypothetical protein
MTPRKISQWVARRGAASGLAVCLLLAAAAVPDVATADSHCQSRKGRGGSRAGRGKSKAAPQPTPSTESSSAAQDDGTDDLSGLDDIAPKPVEPAPKPEPRVAEKPREPEPEPAADEPETPAADAESPASEDEADAPADAETAADEAESGPSIVIEPYAGIGLATRSVRTPIRTGIRRMTGGATPAAEVGLRVVAWPSAQLSLFMNLVYQSALGFTVTERAPTSLERKLGARSERVALEVGPRWRFAGGKLDVTIPVGATVRTLWAEVHIASTPSYSLVGPHARLELRLGLSDMLSLRLAPELHYIMMIDKELAETGVSSSGFALGGDASIDARLSQTWTLGVNYRESHAMLSALRGSVSFLDVERYVTLRAVGSF